MTEPIRVDEPHLRSRTLFFGSRAFLATGTITSTSTAGEACRRQRDNGEVSPGLASFTGLACLGPDNRQIAV